MHVDYPGPGSYARLQYAAQNRGVHRVMPNKTVPVHTDSRLLKTSASPIHLDWH
jgi:hypothetical protein